MASPEKSPPRISVVIPVHNGEAFIGRCLDSVLAQTFSDIEILVLDNESTDRTPAIIAEYEKAYPGKIRVDTHKNLGVAGNRNLGIELAGGEYIMFVDADDKVLPDYCEAFYREIDTGGYNAVLGWYFRTNVKGRVIKTVKPRITTDWAKYQLVTPWAKIHRLSFLREHGIRFNDSYGEDIVFNLHSIFKTDKIKVIKYSGYDWYFNESSITNTIYKGFVGGARVIPMLKRIKELHDCEDPYLDYFLVRSVIYFLLVSGEHGRAEDFVSIEAECFGWLDHNYPGASKCKYLYWGPKGEYFKTNLVVLIFTLIRKMRLQKLFAKVYCKGS